MIKALKERKLANDKDLLLEFHERAGDPH